MIYVKILVITLVLMLQFATNEALPTKQDWPVQCKGKSICLHRPDYYPSERFAQLLDGVKANFLQGQSVANRTTEDDVASCKSLINFGKVYLLLDQNDMVRFVAQNEDAFSIEVEEEECRDPGDTDSSALDEDNLKKITVHCHETRIPFMFPVLKLDGTGLESVAPKDGISVSCSAKVMQINGKNL